MSAPSEREEPRRPHPLFAEHRARADDVDPGGPAPDPDDPVEHLVDAARDLIGAARSVLDALEAVLDDQADARRVRRAAGDPDPDDRSAARDGHDGRDDRTGRARVRRIDVDG